LASKITEKSNVISDIEKASTLSDILELLDRNSSELGEEGIQRYKSGDFVGAAKIYNLIADVYGNAFERVNEFSSNPNSINVSGSLLKTSRSWKQRADASLQSQISKDLNDGYKLHEEGKYDEAIECYDKALEIDPNNADAWNSKGMILGNSGKDTLDNVIIYFDKALAIQPNNVAALRNKGLAYNRKAIL
jgi:tetratricopeptide (TPR) repeat protein